ncbi:Asp23/Gls24 family envelope stress response protein [Anaerotignum sp. MSJ-24]|uniref:Asp23/Gls24 family envelope stress response protein n=1 Tax=Anaerotignum sp. MSJ-24 TaxID=2841521 RepID=UPI001C12263D|nr:Asp23/Gls24 family envelope stress response protein [Anaerotignum sp. MSJ-24]MBD9220425.1 Asp23/Gls24 family envelope stress response protein [Clostridiales bacterium]MBU5463827.1 Asp23/Gls24 family envelope stress response protein [Anaerotignum sp. MSJ-24]
MIEEKEANGQIQISDEVISIIAGTAAAETEGVSLPSSAPVSSVKGFFGKKNQSKGVKVTVEENTALIEIEVVVKFGINIKNACEEVQQKVKNAVETMTGLTVSGVNINVTAIMVEKEQPAQVDIEEETEE